MGFLQTDPGAFSLLFPNDDPGGQPHDVDKVLKVVCKYIEIYLYVGSQEHHVIPVGSHFGIKNIF